MFVSVKTVIGMLEVSAEFARNISFNYERILKALPAGHLDATTLADYLVKKAGHIFWAFYLQHPRIYIYISIRLPLHAVLIIFSGICMLLTSTSVLWLLSKKFLVNIYNNCDCRISTCGLLFLQGMPFRTSHDIVGKSVALCVSKNCQLQDLVLDELKSISSAFEEDVYEFLSVENSINKFSSYGSTGSACVASQMDYWVTKLNIERI